jgi:hypothetical protein
MNTLPRPRLMLLLAALVILSLQAAIVDAQTANVDAHSKRPPG